MECVTVLASMRFLIFRLCVIMNIEKIKISGFKSVAAIELNSVTPFSVFAGPNGAGKSNIADALDFVRVVMESGAAKAIRQFGGFSSVHCMKYKKQRARTFEFQLDANIDSENISYSLKIHNMDILPDLEESLSINGKPIIERPRGRSPRLTRHDTSADIPRDVSALILGPGPIRSYLLNIRVFRFDPFGAKEPDAHGADASELDPHGRNLATMLAGLEKDPLIREQITDWMGLLVPGMEQVATEQQRLDRRTVITFKEEGVKAHFPANLISDGTVYALCIMTAVLSRAQGRGITIIEEPERGIHPKAIAELVGLMRECASAEHPVFITTHSESVVREAKPDELWVVNKLGGKTAMKNAGGLCGDLEGLNLDKAWLMNFFDGGLPW